MKPTYDLDRIMTIKETAAALRMSVRGVREWIKDGTLPFTRMKRRIYIDAGVVESLLRRNAVAPKSPRQMPSGQGGDEYPLFGENDA